MNPASEQIDPQADEDPRVFRAVQEYHHELEAGRRPDRRTFVERFPDLAEAMAPYLDALDMVHAGAPLLHQSSGGRPAPTVAEPLPIEPLGDFRIVREIGRGGMGVVYEAVQLSLGRRVALKMLPFAAALDAKQLQRFKNEAQSAAQLHHTNIVPVYAVGCERGVHYYAMQLIEGHNLADLIAQMRPQELDESRVDVGAVARRRPAGAAPGAPPTGPLVEPAAEAPAPATMTGAAALLSTERASGSTGFYRTAARLGAQAAEALEHAHQLGVIHRDVKPANLMVDARGNLWVTDFGLAQFHNRAGLTRTGDLLGTLRYMSPEQAAGQGAPLDPRTDVYSLGATLYEFLTLEPLFGGGDHGSLLRQILSDEPRPLRAVDHSVPPELETIVLKAVSKNPTDRYATAQEFADDLHRFLDNKPIRARRSTLAQRGRKWAQRHPAVVVAAGVLCLLTAVGSLVSNAMLQREQSRTEAAYEDAKNQEKEALAQAARAEKRFQIAREAVDEMIQVSEEELLDKPGMERVRNRLLESALKYYQQFIEQRRDDPVAQAELAANKERVGKILTDLTALQGAGPYNLLSWPNVLTDLRASAEQRAQIAELNRPLDQQLKELFEGAGRRPGKEPSRPILKFAEMAVAREAGAKEILTAQQVRRLKQIDLQLKEVSAFRDPDVGAALMLTDGQKEGIRNIEGDHFCGPGKRGGPGGQGRDREPDRRPASEKLKEVLEKVLTAEQAARWKEMTGEPFTGRVFRPGLPPGRPPGPRPEPG